MTNLLRQHGHALRAAWRNFAHAPGSFLMNILVLAIALALPLFGLIVLSNVRPVASQLAAQPEISVFMTMTTSRENAVALESSIRQITQNAGEPAKLVFIPREKALATLKDRTSLAEALTTLDINPLPDAYVVTVPSAKNTTMATDIDQIASRIGALPGVDNVQLDSAWIKRLAALIQLLQLVLEVVAVTLALVVIAVVFNTVRLQVLGQRDQIAVSRLLGATNRFIYRPFCYSGALLGLLGGVAAVVATLLALVPINAAIAEVARLYASQFQLLALGWQETGLFLTISAFLGYLGSFLSVRRHLVASA